MDSLLRDWLPCSSGANDSRLPGNKRGEESSSTALNGQFGHLTEVTGKGTLLVLS